MNGIKYRKPEEMKDSGTDWLGMISEEWELIKLKYNSMYKASNVDKLTVEGEYPVLLCNYVDVYKNKVINEQIDFMQATATRQEIKNFSLKGGYILITKDSESPDDIGIPAYVPFTLPNVLCGYHLSIIDTDPKKLNPKYLFALFSSQGVRNYFETKAKGITRYSLSMESFRNIIIPVISVEEQHKIANFLDMKTAQFDSIIAKKELLIQKLEEVKKSLISEIVTGKVKIIDGEMVPRQSEEMKDSGVEWLGMIPKDWTVIKIKYLLKKDKDGIKIGPFGSSLKLSETSLDFPYKVYGQENLIKEDYSLGSRFITAQKFRTMNQYELKNGDIVISMMGTIGKSTIVPVNIVTGIMDSHLMRIRINKMIVDANYINTVIRNAWYIKSQFDYFSNGSIMSGLNSTIIKNLLTVIPDIDEQKKIVDFLDAKTSQFNSIIASNKLLTQKLKQAKQSLISEAVTGKIDLRDWEITEVGEVQ